MEQLKIFIQQLQQGEQEKVDLTVAPGLFEIEEKDLILESPVSIKGEIYVTDHHLILHLDAHTTAKIRCAICNELASIPLAATIYESLPLSELVESIFDYSHFVKEEILLQIPLFTECQGNCPERARLQSFLKQPEPKKSSEPTHFPFSEL